MAVHEAIIFGMGVITFLLFDLWYRLREDHPELSIFFFGIGLGMIDIIAFTVYKFMTSETSISYLSIYALAFFQIIMWFTLLVSIVIIALQIWGAAKIVINWSFSLAGWEPPFKEERKAKE